LGEDYLQPITLNKYAYCLDNPINFVDPYGTQPHIGFIKALGKMGSKSLMKTIRSLEKVILKHEKPLNPQDVKKYAHEKRVAEEQLRLAKEEAVRKGLLGVGVIEKITPADKQTTLLDSIIEAGEFLIDIFSPVEVSPVY
jgi:hypothetical protein